MTLELPGSKTRAVTAMFAMKSSSGDQLAPAFVGFQMPPAFVVFKSPPAPPAAYIGSGVTGSIMIARVRPPTLPGPNDCQVPSTPLVEPADNEAPLVRARTA